MTAEPNDTLPCRRALRAWVSVRALALGAVMVMTACGDPDTPQSPTSPTNQRLVEVYTGMLSPGGSGFYSFQVRASETASYTLASLTHATTGRALDVELTLAAGVPAGEDCNVSSSTAAAPSLTPQLSGSVSPGIYCVKLSDPGRLTAAANFAVRIQHP